MIWIGLFGVAALVLLARLVKGPTMGDRMLSLNILSGIVVMLTLYYAIETSQTMYLDFSLMIAILSFTGMIGLVRWSKK